MRVGFTSTIAIKKPTVTSEGRYGNDSYDYGVEPIPVPDLVALQPVSSSESGAPDNRHTTTQTFRLITQPGVDLDLAPIDRVVWAGRELDVVSEVLRWPHPMLADAVHHLEATLQLVKG